MTEAPGDDEGKWRRRLASAANNRAWTLSEMPVRSPAEDDEMLNAAHASCYLWSTIGTDKHLAMSDLLLGQIHALLGHGTIARRHADAAFAFFSSRESEAWETAFAHAVLAHAAHAEGDADVHRAHYQSALDAAGAMTDPEDRTIFDATFNVVPVPAG